MKKIVLSLCLLSLAFVSCKEQSDNYASYGAQINADDVMTTEQMNKAYTNLVAGDTLKVKFAADINEVCSKKGCWMKLELSEENEAMVRFKDYGFFMPLDAADKNVIVRGKAYIKTTPVEELQHYAADAGKSEEEIAQITTPKVTYAFEADGVLLKK